MPTPQIDPNTGEVVHQPVQIDPNTGEVIAAHQGQQNPTFWSDPKAYLLNRAEEMGKEAQRQQYLAEGPESQGKSWLSRNYHSALSAIPQTARIVDKAAAALFDPTQAAVITAGAVDPAIPAAYYMQQGTQGAYEAGKDIKNKGLTPENTEAGLTALSGVAAGATGAGAENAGRAAQLPRQAANAVDRSLLLGRSPQEAYQSALKPSITKGNVKIQQAVNTGLNSEIPVSKAGVEKLQSLIDNTNDSIADTIAAGPAKTVNKFKVASRLSDTAEQFSNQVTPAEDLRAISKTGNEFLRDQPAEIPAAAAQKMKQGTYRQLGSKAYGELKASQIESQKALARGLKEELAEQFPELKELNAKDSEFYNLQGMLEKAVDRVSNHDTIGIGTPVAVGAAKTLTGSASVAAVVGLVKAIVDNPNVKSRLAIAVNKASKGRVSMAQANSRIAAYSAALGSSIAQSANNAPAADQGSQQQP